MKTILIVCCMLFCVQNAMGRDRSESADSSGSGKNTTPNNLLIRANSRNAWATIRPNETYYNFGAMWGTGAQLLLGFKLDKSTTCLVGYDRMWYHVRQTAVEKALHETFAAPWFTTTVYPHGNSTLTQSTFLLQISQWRQTKKAILEYYGNMRLGSFRYSLQTDIYRIYQSLDRAIYTHFDKGASNNAFILGAGVQYSHPLSPVFYISTALEYDYNITHSTWIYRDDYYSQGTHDYHTEGLPTPAYLFNFQIGILYKPVKPCHCHEQKPW